VAHRDTPAESTVKFLPNRLNRQPVVVQGLTTDELWITVGASSACGLAFGIVLSLLTGSLAIAPTLMLVCAGLGVWIGGALLRRHKRGRPDTWLQRQIQWWIARHMPLLAPRFGADELITRSGYWSIHRARRR
jgi:conjugative transfer region protein (TIGR03750 family)